METVPQILERLQHDVCGYQEENNLYAPSTNAQDAFNELVRYFMGDDYNPTGGDPITNGQANTNALVDIELAYRKSFCRWKVINWRKWNLIKSIIVIITPILLGGIIYGIICGLG